MRYSVRYAHMQKESPLSICDTVKYGDYIGTMGTSGQSSHSHLHIDVVEGYHNKIIRLKDIMRYKPNEKQLNFFIDKDLFKVAPYITTPYMSDRYRELYGKDHPAFDCVPEDRHITEKHYDIYYNRTKEGIVLANGYDKNGYGHYIIIGFEA